MKFKYHIYKTGNLFHFVSNLTEWHFACRPHYNETWIKQTGALTKEERRAIASLKKLLLKYNYGQKFLGKPFMGLPNKNAWREVENLVTEKELETIKNIFNLLKPRFEKVWRKERAVLEEWKKGLESSQMKSNQMLKTLEKFFATKPEVKKLDVYLLMSTQGTGGGANIGKGKITVELSKKAAKERVFCLIWHEAIHALFQEHIDLLINEYIKKNKLEKEVENIGLGRDARNLINEALVSSLIPEGYLSEKFFNKSVYKPDKAFRERLKKDKNFGLIRAYLSWKLYNEIKKYIENKKQLDQKYLKKIHRSYLDYLKEIS